MKTPSVVLVAALLAMVPASGIASTAPAAKASASKSAAEPAGRPMVFPFIHDDYAKAIATAKAQRVPIFVDAGAPWCHTCRSMDAFVFTDPALAKDAGRFVWLSVNTENRKNAAFLKKNKIPALPTYLVIDPLTEKVVMRWVGGASVTQLHQFLDDADVALHGGKPREPVDIALARADDAYSNDRYAEAATAYREAMAAAPEVWTSYGRCVEALLFALSQADSNQAVIDLAHDVMPKVGSTSTYVSAAGSGLSSALALPDENLNKKQYLAEFEAQLRSGLSDASIQLASDDRSSCLAMLIDAREAAGDSIGQRAAAQDWSDFLDRAAREARTPVERAVFDPHRLSAYLAVGTPEKAIPMLELSQKEFPNDCNPPARLAIAYYNMKEYDKALAASDKAMAMPMADGPRKLLYYDNRINIYTGMGNSSLAKKTLEDEIAFASALPDGQRSEKRIEGLKKRLEKMNQTSSVAH
jgi:thioredoxin-like negative regulator of GroEL